MLQFFRINCRYFCSVNQKVAEGLKLCNSLSDVERLVQMNQPINEWNKINCVTGVHRFSKYLEFSCFFDSEVLSTLLAQLKVVLKRKLLLKPVAISNLLVSLAKLDSSPLNVLSDSELLLFLGLLSPYVTRESLIEFGSQNIANSYWALAKIFAARNFSDAILPGRRQGDQRISTICHSYAVQVYQELPDKLDPHEPGYKRQALSNVLWASGVFLIASDSVHQFLLTQFLQQYRSFNGQDFSNGVWGLSRVYSQVDGIQSDIRGTIFNSFKDPSSPLKFSNFHDLAMLVSALSNLDCMVDFPTDILDCLGESLADKIVSEFNSGGLQGQAVCTALCGFAKLRYYNSRFLFSVNRVLAVVKTPHHKAYTVWALAVFGFRPSLAISEILGDINLLNDRAALVLWTLAVLDIKQASLEMLCELARVSLRDTHLPDHSWKQLFVAHLYFASTLKTPLLDAVSLSCAARAFIASQTADLKRNQNCLHASVLEVVEKISKKAESEFLTSCGFGVDILVHA